MTSDIIPDEIQDQLLRIDHTVQDMVAHNHSGLTMTDAAGDLMEAMQDLRKSIEEGYRRREEAA